MTDKPENENDGAPEAWLTIDLKPPSPNAHFAGFVSIEGNEVKASTRAIDFVAVQHILDENGDLLESRIVPVIFEWSGEARALVVGEESAGPVFCSVAPSASEAQKLAERVGRKLLAELGEKAAEAKP